MKADGFITAYFRFIWQKTNPIYSGNVELLHWLQTIGYMRGRWRSTPSWSRVSPAAGSLEMNLPPSEVLMGDLINHQECNQEINELRLCSIDQTKGAHSMA